MSTRTCFIFQLIFPNFFQVYWLARGPETNIVASSDSVSHLIHRAFRWYIMTFFCYCPAGWTSFFHRYVDLSLSQYVLRFSVLNKWCFNELPNIMNVFIKSKQKWLQMSWVRSENFQTNISEQQLACRWTWSMNAKLGTFETSLVS